MDIIIIAVFLGIIAWNVNLARKQGRNAVLAGCLAFFFGIFSVIFYYILGNKEKQEK